MAVKISESTGAVLSSELDRSYNALATLNNRQ